MTVGGDCRPAVALASCQKDEQSVAQLRMRGKHGYCLCFSIVILWCCYAVRVNVIHFGSASLFRAFLLKEISSVQPVYHVTRRKVLAETDQWPDSIRSVFDSAVNFFLWEQRSRRWNHCKKIVVSELLLISHYLIGYTGL